MDAAFVEGAGRHRNTANHIHQIRHIVQQTLGKQKAFHLVIHSGCGRRPGRS